MEYATRLAIEGQISVLKQLENNLRGVREALEQEVDSAKGAKQLPCLFCGKPSMAALISDAWKDMKYETPVCRGCKEAYTKNITDRKPKKPSPEEEQRETNQRLDILYFRDQLFKDTRKIKPDGVSLDVLFAGQSFGTLWHDERGFCFAYNLHAGQLYELPEFPDHREADNPYTSPELFASFAKRIPSPSRPDFSDFLAKYRLTDLKDPLEYLARSQGSLITDSISLRRIEKFHTGCDLSTDDAQKLIQEARNRLIKPDDVVSDKGPALRVLFGSIEVGYLWHDKEGYRFAYGPEAMYVADAVLSASGGGRCQGPVSGFPELCGLNNPYTSAYLFPRFANAIPPPDDPAMKKLGLEDPLEILAQIGHGLNPLRFFPYTLIPKKSLPSST